MYHGKKIAVIIAAYNEEKFVGQVLDTMPTFVDFKILVDDGSKDKTFKVAMEHKDERTYIIRHKKNQGPGAADISAHKMSFELGADINVHMAGDGQMDPKYLTKLLDVIIDDGYDMAKGNRFYTADSLKQMPKFRIFGNLLLTLLSKFATGYWGIVDPANGYTAIKTEFLKAMDLNKITKSFAYEFDILFNMNIQNARVIDVNIPALYGQEKSHIKLFSFMPRTALLLIRRFFKRINTKYIWRDFHPIGLFYYLSLFLFVLSFFLGIIIGIQSIGPQDASAGSTMVIILSIVTGFQCLVTAIILDMMDKPK